MADKKLKDLLNDFTIGDNSTTMEFDEVLTLSKDKEEKMILSSEFKVCAFAHAVFNKGEFPVFTIVKRGDDGWKAAILRRDILDQIVEDLKGTL